MRALRAEWELRCLDLPKEGLVSVYLGGGTPSLLNYDELGEILSWIQPGPDVEVTLEANPDRLKIEDLRHYAHLGINRLSIGAQSLHDGMLQKLSRTHTAAQTLQLIEAAAQVGLSNISIDLMYDIPDQTLEIWQETVDQVTQLPITHLSLYNLTIEPHTAFYKRRHTLHVPDSETSFNMLQYAEKRWLEQGWERYELSAFAREGKVSRHNLGYWTDRPFLGLGPSAFSDWNKSRFQNIPHFWKYVRSCLEGTLPVHFTETLTSQERERERVAVGLRVLKGVTVSPAYLQWLTPLIEEGWLEAYENILKLTPQGRLFYDSVCEKIYELAL